MKRLKLIYNPYSGGGAFKETLDETISAFQSGGYDVHIFRSTVVGDIAEHIGMMTDDYDAIVVAGGDGSINIVINAMMNSGKTIPLGIIPSGTANDFAGYLKIPKDPSLAAELITHGSTKSFDVGLANDKYFINVCAAGLFSNISESMDSDVKDVLGKLGYYLKGLGQLPSFQPFAVRITTNDAVIEENLVLFIVLNSSGTGGLEGLAPDAAADDGLFDLIAIKDMSIVDFGLLFIKLMKGELVGHPNVLYLRDSYFKIDHLSSDNAAFSSTDIDGERGPDMPIEIKNINKRLEIFVNPDNVKL